MAKRVPVGFAMAMGQHPLVDKHAYCICDDGSYWHFNQNTGEWEEERPIPGSDRWDELSGPGSL